MTGIFGSMKSTIFVVDLIVHYILLFGIVWSVAFPKKRVWPPPKKWSWQYIVTWVGFYAAFILNGLLVVLDWNSWVLENNIRFFIGVPLVITGVLFFLWAFTTLGAENTSGIKSADQANALPCLPIRLSRIGANVAACVRVYVRPMLFQEIVKRVL